MKKVNYILAIMFMMSVAGIVSCYYDEPPPVQPIDPESVSFSTHILPIFTRSCATSSCHDGTTPPKLLSETAWSELRKGGFLNISVPEESALYKDVSYLPGGVPMPPGGPKLPELDQILILAWIQNGAPDN